MARLEINSPWIEEMPSSCGAGWQPTVWKSIESKAIVGEFPAGEYFIGDFSCLMKQGIYQDVWEKHFNFKDGVYEASNGSRFATVSCDCDTGLARGSDGSRYAFEASFLGICSVECCDLNNIDSRCGTIHEFVEPVHFLFVPGKRLSFRSGSWNLTIRIN